MPRGALLENLCWACVAGTANIAARKESSAIPTRAFILLMIAPFLSRLHNLGLQPVPPRRPFLYEPRAASGVALRSNHGKYLIKMIIWRSGHRMIDTITRWPDHPILHLTRNSPTRLTSTWASRIPETKPPAKPA